MTAPFTDHAEQAAESDHRRRLQRALGDDYELRGLIGRGGFGAVYVAWDRRLERDVAVKALRHDLFPTLAVLERFRREAKAVAKLRHHNVLPVYSVGEGEGLAFMVMPFIRGQSLRAVLESPQRLPMGEAVRVAVDLARALDAAHRMGIVHRDLKPDNVLIEDDDRHVLLADFGIAKAMQGDSDITGTGVVIGSPQYMSPEQAAGERSVDERSDIYSLGAVTYEMLSGRPPYEANGFQQLLVKQITTDPPPLSEIVPGITPRLAGAVMRSIAKDPNARWGSASEFGAELVAAVDSTDRPGGPARWSESWLEKRGLLVLFLGVLIYYQEVVARLLVAAQLAQENAMSIAFGPLSAAFGLVIGLLGAELVWKLAAAAVRGGSRSSVLRAGFSQPGWWQTWYPRSLRHPESVWDAMPFEVRALRTVLWLMLAAIPVALPLIFVVPTLQKMAAGAGMQLPVGIRTLIAASSFLKGTVIPSVALGALGLGIVWISARHRVPLGAVVRCLLTWRREWWNGSPARRLLARR